jgi:ABC-type branched-subunit amino acid transport system ATPase component
MSRDGKLLLETAGLTVHYGGTVANEDVSISVHAGEIVGLIGPNGAGKTTFIDAITGFTQSSGTVLLDSHPLHHMPPHARRARGLARTWQAGELFADLTVEENLTVAVRRLGLRSFMSDLFGRRHPQIDSVRKVMELLTLSEDAQRLPAELPLGRQRLVGVGRALVGDSRMVLLDEPAAGLDTNESAVFSDDVRRIAKSGIGVLLIDHDMSLVLNVCDYIYVLDFGHVIADGTPGEVQADKSVVAAYLGTAEHEAMAEE